jgi:hypothetical protein
MRKQVKVTFERPQLGGYSNTINYISKNGKIKSEMPVSHQIYRCILSTMRESGKTFLEVLNGETPLRISGNLVAYSDEQLANLVGEFVANVKFSDK